MFIAKAVTVGERSEFVGRVMGEVWRMAAGDKVVGAEGGREGLERAMKAGVGMGVKLFAMARGDRKVKGSWMGKMFDFGHNKVLPGVAG